MWMSSRMAPMCHLVLFHKIRSDTSDFVESLSLSFLLCTRSQNQVLPPGTCWLCHKVELRSDVFSLEAVWEAEGFFVFILFLVFLKSEWKICARAPSWQIKAAKIATVANKQTFQEDSSVPLSACQATKPYFNATDENRPTVDGGTTKKPKRKQELHQNKNIWF